MTTPTSPHPFSERARELARVLLEQFEGARGYLDGGMERVEEAVSTNEVHYMESRLETLAAACEDFVEIVRSERMAGGKG